MFKRSLSPEAFDQFSSEKREILPSTRAQKSDDLPISDFSKWTNYLKILVPYERHIYGAFAALVCLLFIFTYGAHLQYQDDIDAQLNQFKKQLLLHQAEISAIKTDWPKNQIASSGNPEEMLASDQPIPEINYLGTFHQGTMRRGLIAHASFSDDQPKSKTQWVSVGQVIELIGTIKAIEDRYLVIESSGGKLVTIWAEEQR